MWPFNKRQIEQQPELPKKQNHQARRHQTPNTEFKANTRSLTGLPNKILGSYGTGVQNVNINAVLRQSLTGLRDASRSLVLQNPYARQYVNLSAGTVAGADGITVRPSPIGLDGSTDHVLADQLDKLFYQWASDANRFSADGTISFDTFQVLAERTRATDGECYVRLHNDGDELQVSIIDAARIPSTKNELLKDGSFISNGIERDKNGRVVAYHVADVHPLNYTIQTNSTSRVPANEVLHYFLPEFAGGQERGFPDCIAVIKTLNRHGFNRHLRVI